MSFEKSVDLSTEAEALRTRILGLMQENSAFNGDYAWVLFEPDSWPSKSPVSNSRSTGKEVLVMVTHPEIDDFGMDQTKPKRSTVMRILTKELFMHMEDDEKIWSVQDVTLLDNDLAQFAHTMVEYDRDGSVVPVFDFLPATGQPDIAGSRTAVLSYIGADGEIVYPFGNYDHAGSIDAIKAAHYILDETVILESSRTALQTFKY